MIKIVTDSTSYLPKELQTFYDISIVSLYVTFNQQTVREVDVDYEAFYNSLKSADQIPTSSQPSPEELSNAFEKIIKEGNEVLGIFISSKMSGTFSNAHMIKEELLEKYPNAKIQILDSTSNCMQLGFMALEAAKWGKQGHTMEEVIAHAKEVCKHSRFLFTPDTLTYLKKGGRIGSASALLGNLLQIKPILTVNNGETSIFSKVRTKKKALQALVDGLMKDLEGRKLGGLVVHHIHCPNEGQELADALSKSLNHPVSIVSIGPVIGAHVGPGSIGLAYFTIPN